MTDDTAGAGGLDGTEVPPEIDPTKASIARLYDYTLGGKEHFEVDRRATESLYAVVPETNQLAKDNRAMLQRGVRYLVGEAGITQIIDLGSGLPTTGNVHEIARETDPDVHVVYVDIDPIVLAHGRALLSDDKTTTVIVGDIRDYPSVFAHPELVALIDTSKPYAVIASGILHHLDDEHVGATVEAIKERLTPGSYLFISHFLDDDEPRAKELEQAFLHGGLGTGRFRTWAEQQAFFEGLELVEPGLVYANDWRPDEDTHTSSPVYTLHAGGVGRKP